MNNSQNFKTLWWLILVVVIGYYFYGRYDQLILGKPSYFDTIAFIIWVGICLAPIFQEMDLFGVKLKQQVEQFQKDMFHQLAILKTEITSSIEVSNANQNNISVNAASEPLKDSDLKKIEKRIDQLMEQKGIKISQPNLPDIDDVKIEMFKVRSAFETLVQERPYNIGNSVAYTAITPQSFSPRRHTLGRELDDLMRNTYISKDILSSVKEIISVCNTAIHGGELTESQLHFVRTSAPKLYKALENELQNYS
ncbi:TPA: hypothetical protein P0E33_004885 [Vibrio harveyi]|nr:hypothetical protein [Vibrio harveyi]HDM8182936.1 hypothetical protein [Vibrio harveyi]